MTKEEEIDRFLDRLEEWIEGIVLDRLNRQSCEGSCGFSTYGNQARKKLEELLKETDILIKEEK